MPISALTGLAALLVPLASSPAAEEPQVTDVAVLGLIHGDHRTSERWGLAELRATIRRVAPEVVLCEIPPDRWERIRTDWDERRAIEDERVLRFPEYTDVLLPLTDELGFAIEPCAAWTSELAALRRARVESFREHELFAEYEAAERAVRERLAADPIVADDPHVIHSRLYDERTKAELGPYDRYLNDWIGPGGWTNVNTAHMALIDAALDRHRGERVLITFGAGHKHWFLERLRARADVRLIDVTPYLPDPDEVSMDTRCRAEALEMHAFFANWFNGEVEAEDAVFARFADVLDDEFEIIGPDGAETPRPALLSHLRAAHGERAEAPMRIWLENIAVRDLGSGHHLITYEEWQELDGTAHARRSSALVAADPDTPNGVRWLHVHETWLGR